MFWTGGLGIDPQSQFFVLAFRGPNGNFTPLQLTDFPSLTYEDNEANCQCVTAIYDGVENKLNLIPADCEEQQAPFL